jgi:hypothetical protein
LSFKRRLASLGATAALAGSLLGALAPASLAASDNTSFLGTCTPSSCSVVADGISTIVIAGQNTDVPTDQSLYLTISGATFTGTAGNFTLVNSTTVTSSATSITTSDTITVRAPTSPGSATITVYEVPTAGGNATLEGTFTVDFYAASALAVSEANSSVTLDSTVLKADGSNHATLAVVVKNGHGDTITSNVSVTATITPIGLVNGLQQASDNTSPYEFTIQGSGLAGVATLGISVTYGGVTTAFAPRTITFTGDLATITLTNVKYAIGQNVSTATHVAKVVAKDSAGNDLTTSTLCPSLTVASSPALTGLTVAGSPAWDATAGACFVDATTTASAAFGSTSITVSSTSPAVTSNAVTLYVSGDPDSFTVAFDKTTVAPGGTATFTITVKDANGLPVPDATTTTAVTNGGVLLVGSSGGVVMNSKTSNGVATYTLVAPNTTGVVTVTAVVDPLPNQSASITVAVPVTVSATAGTALGVTTSGPFSTTTKVQALGGYVTWKFSFGAAGAGQTVEIWRAVKQADGTWSGFTLLTKRVANSNGDVFFYWRSSSATWISVRGKLGTTYTPALQARWK